VQLDEVSGEGWGPVGVSIPNTVLPPLRCQTTLIGVTDKRTHIQDLIGPRRDWTPVAVLTHKGDAFYARLLELAEARRWQLISLYVYDGFAPPDVELRGALVDQLPTETNVQALLARGIPVVRIGNLPHPDDARVPAVMPDKEAFGKLAAEHFAARDFKHIAYIGRDSPGVHQPMYDGLTQRAHELGMTVHPKVLANDELIQIRKQIGQRDNWLRQRPLIEPWFAQLPKPVGLLCHSDIQAARYCLWASHLGIETPQQLAVLTAGSHPLIADSTTMPLSCIEADEAGTLATAADMLGRLMDHQPLERTTVMIPPRGVTTRRSTDVLAASDPIVVEALRFMWDHIAEDLSVDQIAEHMAVSRRRLELAFRKDLGRSVNAEFQRRRLEKACELITMTDLPIGEVAGSMGYNSHTHFGRAFRAAYGVTPAAYRSTHHSSASHAGRPRDH